MLGGRLKTGKKPQPNSSQNQVRNPPVYKQMSPRSWLPINTIILERVRASANATTYRRGHRTGQSQLFQLSKLYWRLSRSRAEPIRDAAMEDTNIIASRAWGTRPRTWCPRGAADFTNGCQERLSTNNLSGVRRDVRRSILRINRESCTRIKLVTGGEGDERISVFVELDRRL